ncbi:MAG: hypothetical protein IJU36_01445 [Paludibacteraceae bacterium]|nr:hypothetical protein [Paludibacteraceae bacterium]
MAHVQWSTGIDHVSGALSKPSKNGQHSCTQMLLGTHRVAETTNPNCNRIYLRKPAVRSTAVKASEIQQRQRFGAIARAVNARAQDVSKIAADQAAFKAQKDTAGGKKTMRSYLWSLEIQAYDNN